MLCLRQRLNMKRLQIHLFYLLKRFIHTQMTFNIRQFIKPCQKSFLRSFMNCSTLTVLNHKNRSVFDGSLFLWCFYRKFINRAMMIRLTQCCNRTFHTPRRSVGYAHHCSELHQCLIKIAGCLFRHDPQQFLFDLTANRLLHDILTILGDPGKNTKDITVNCRNRNIISDRCDRACGVTADSL